MKKFLVTYYNGKTHNSVIVRAKSLDSAIAQEELAVAMFQRTNPAIRLESVEAI